jgi:hypothetical protein
LNGLKLLIASCPDVPLRDLEAGNTHEKIFQEFLLGRIPFIGNEIRNTGKKMEGTVPVSPIPPLYFVITTYYLLEDYCIF